MPSRNVKTLIIPAIILVIIVLNFSVFRWNIDSNDSDVEIQENDKLATMTLLDAEGRALKSSHNDNNKNYVDQESSADDAPASEDLITENDKKVFQEIGSKSEINLTKNKYFDLLLGEAYTQVKGDDQEDYCRMKSAELNIFPYNTTVYNNLAIGNNEISSECSVLMFQMKKELEKNLQGKKECDTIEISDRRESTNRVKVLKDYSEEDMKEFENEYLENMLGKNYLLKEPFGDLKKQADVGGDSSDIFETFGDHLVYESGFDLDLVKREINEAWSGLIKDGIDDPRLEGEDILEYEDVHIISDEKEKSLNITQIKSIPNIYHFIWLGCDREFLMHNFATLISLVKHAKIKKLLFHTDCEPVKSPLWQTFKCFVNSRNDENNKKFEFKILKTRQIDYVWGNHIKRIEHKVDVYKLMLIYSVGGIYIDDDIMTLTPYEEILTREKNFDLLPVLGEESEYSVSNAFIASLPKDKFIAKWYYAYKSYQPGLMFGRFSVMTAWSLWRKYPNTCHIIRNKMIRPDFRNGGFMLKNYTLFNWMNQYNIHLQPRFFKENGLPKGEISVKYLISADSVLGEILRYTLIGRWRPRREDCSAVSNIVETDGVWWEKGKTNVDIWYDDDKQAENDLVEEESID